MGTTTIAEKKSYSPVKILNIAITLLLMFGFGYLPPIGTITPIGMKVLGVFLGVVYGYSACDVIWPSLFAIIAYGMCGYTTMGAAITEMMGHNIVFQSICGFIAAGGLSYYGFGKWFVRWSLNLPIFKGRPMLYVWSFFVLFGLSSVVVNQIVLSLILYGIWVDIAENCGYEKGSNFYYYGFCGILFSTMLGGAMIPYTSWMLGLANVWGDVTGSPLNQGIMACVTIPATILICTVYAFLGKAIFKIDISNMQHFDTEKMGEESKKLRPRAKRILIIYLITVFIAILANTLIGSALANFVNGVMTTAGLYCACAAILMILPSGEGDGKACVVFNEIKNTAIAWPVIFMCAVTIPVAGAVTNEATGIVPFLSGLFSPIFEGRGGVFVLTFTILLSLLLTNVGSNIAFGAAMIPIIAPFAVKTGMNPMFFGAAMIYTVNIGAVLPGASAPAGIYHAREELPNAGKRMSFALVGCLSLAIVCIPLFSIVGTILS